jgi:hypothetical protein
MTKLALFVFTGIFLLPLFVNAQNTSTAIVLHDEKFSFTPHEFYIAVVADERKDRSSVASLLDTKDPTHPLVKADLKGGAITTIKNFLSHNLDRDTSLRPIILTIKEFEITETGLPGGRVSGHLGVAFSFSLQQSYETVHLTDYTGGIRYNRPDSKPADIEPIFRQGIEDALAYFNTWINSHADNSALLAKSVKVSFTDYTEKPEGDTIYYSAHRPLTWADFKDKVRNARYEAEVFTSIGYIEKNEVKNGAIHINLAIKVYVAKSDCWVRSGGSDTYILNHEQRHFDIEKVVSEHFKEKILAMRLPVENFDGPINVQYLETLREATAIQKQYDADTRHGQDRQAQAQWDVKIDRELKAYGYKK